jgi:hypothetical protein
LGRAEKFFIGIRAMQLFVPHVEYLLLAGCGESIVEVRYQFGRLLTSINAVARSKALIQILTYVLRLGNIMNGGTPRGGAYGFSIQFLPKLSDVRGRVQGVTLLHYIAEKNAAAVTSLQEELRPLLSSEKIDIESLKGTLGDVTTNLKKLEAVMPEAQQLVLQGYQLFPKFTELSKELEPALAEARSIAAKLDEKYQEVAKTFGDDPKKTDVAQWLGTITAFLRGIVRASEENAAREKAKADAARRAADLASRSQKGLRPDINALVPGAAQRGILDELEKRFAGGARLPRS